MRKNLFIGIAIFVVLGGVFFVMRDRGEESQSSSSDFDKFAHITLVDYNGNTVSLEEFRGKPLL